MRKRILIFDDVIDGHHLEYLHHLYEVAQTCTERDFVFSVPKSLEEVKDKYEWKQCSHIQWDFIHDENILNKGENLLFHSFRICKILRRKAKENRADKIFVISLMGYLPFLPLFFLFSGVKVSGIIYLIYLFRWRQSTLMLKISDIIKYQILSKCRIFENVFILNSTAAARYLNHKYFTNHFKCLPDPYENHFFCDDFPSSSSKKNILHFGSLNDRKGTLELLHSIGLLTPEEGCQYKFVFAGRVNSEISGEFYQLFETLKHRYDISLYDKFCSFEEINRMCAEADYIVIPYKSTAQSSGVIGYAAQYKRPLIAPSSGLIGRIIKKYRLGVLIDEITPESIYFALTKKIPFFDLKYMKTDLYLIENSLNAFKASIISILE